MAKEKKVKVRMTVRQKQLFWVVVVAAFFEGFDDGVVNIALPYISNTFSLDEQTRGFVLSIIAVGTMIAFVASRLADRIGRRPVFLWCTYGFAICSLVTAFAPWLWLFVAVQCLARVFLIGCWSVGYVILIEEFEASQRGYATGRFQLMAVFGGLLIAILLTVVVGNSWLNEAMNNESWRILFAVGVLPLIPVFLMRKRLPETEAFVQRKRNAEQGIEPEKTNMMEVWKNPYRKYIIVMGIVWFFLYVGNKGALNFFTTRVVEELGWQPGEVTIALVAATLLGLFLIALNGKLMDIIGRKKAAMIIILVGVATSVATFQFNNQILVIVFNVLSTGCLYSFLIMGSTITNELFPTRMRSTAMAWGNNIFGRIGQIAVPTFIGTMTLFMTLGHAVAIAMLLPLISLVLIMVFIPETSKRSIADIDGDSAEEAALPLPLDE